MGKRKTKNQGRKKKLNLVFDENKRKEFLCGFRKRKLERKKKAQDELQKMLKEEKGRIKQENRESYKKLVVSSRPIPSIEKLLQEEYEDEDVNVKIVELSADTLQQKDLVIGENKPKEVISKNKTKKKENVPQELPGMGLEEGNNSESEELESEDENKIKTKKEIKRILKKQATKKIQKSKVFQMKSKLDRIKNKKKSHQKAVAIGKTKSNAKKGGSKKNIGRRKQ